MRLRRSPRWESTRIADRTRRRDQVARRGCGGQMGSKRELADLLATSAVLPVHRPASGGRSRGTRRSPSCPPGVDLIKEGEPGDALFVILDGDGRRAPADGVELNRVGPGAYFGELAILDGEPRSATVVAETDVKVAVIGIRMFRTLLPRVLGSRRAAAHRSRGRAARGAQGPGARLMEPDLVDDRGRRSAPAGQPGLRGPRLRRPRDAAQGARAAHRRAAAKF